jgi:multisubunit Na+/H+ antiporter MnhE subunit
VKVRAIVFVGLIAALWVFLGLTLEWVSALVGLAMGVGLYIGLKRTILKRVFSAGGISWRSPIEIAVAMVGYAWAVAVSNVQVARLIVTWRRPVKSAIVRLYTGDMGDLEQSVLANSITLTPGTIVLDFSPDRRWLYVHVLDVWDVDEAHRQLDRHLRQHFEGGLRWWRLL